MCMYKNVCLLLCILAQGARSTIFLIILRNLQSLMTLPISCNKNAKIERTYYETEKANF